MELRDIAEHNSKQPRSDLIVVAGESEDGENIEDDIRLSSIEHDETVKCVLI